MTPPQTRPHRCLRHSLSDLHNLLWGLSAASQAAPPCLLTLERTLSIPTEPRPASWVNSKWPGVQNTLGIVLATLPKSCWLGLLGYQGGPPTGCPGPLSTLTERGATQEATWSHSEDGGPLGGRKGPSGPNAEMHRVVGNAQSIVWLFVLHKHSVTFPSFPSK